MEVGYVTVYWIAVVSTATDRQGYPERSKKMINQEMAHRGFGSVEGRFVSLTHGGRGLSLLLAVQEAAGAALARAQEDATLEAQDSLSQADEALVLG